MKFEANSVLLVSPTEIDARTQFIYGAFARALEVQSQSLDANFVKISRKNLLSRCRISDLPDGACRVNLNCNIITMDPSSFVSLASLQKQSVLFGHDISKLVNNEQAVARKYMKTLIWSGLNTTNLIALDPPTWVALQLLTFNACAYRECPPIQLPCNVKYNSSNIYPEVLIIDHTEGGSYSKYVIDIASAECGRFIYYKESVLTNPISVKEPALSEHIRIHIHIGMRKDCSILFRVQDSWASGKAIILIDVDSSLSSTPISNFIADGINAIIIKNIEELAKALTSIKLDSRLFNAMTSRGSRLVAKSFSTWAKIAEEFIK